MDANGLPEIEGLVVGSPRAIQLHTMAIHWTELPGHGVSFFATTMVVAVVALVCFTGRTYTCFVYTKRFRLDYWLSLATLVYCT